MKRKLRQPMRMDARRSHGQRGISIIELMVGMALGLMIVAATLVLLAGNLRDNRALLLESRLMQDLRTASDLIARDLRRAGYWGAAASGVWRPGVHAIAGNPYSAVAPSAAASDVVSFRFSRDEVENDRVDSNEQFGFRLRRGVIQMRLGGGGWQALTDAGTLAVTDFRITPLHLAVALANLCRRPCPVGGGATCPPRQWVRSLAVSITGHATRDAAVIRSVHSQVRLRNDLISGSCPV